MSVWQVIALVWISVGVACVVAERVIRDASQDSLRDSVAMAVLLLLLAPVVVAYCLGVVLSSLWRRWWPAREKKFGLMEQSDDTTLVRMIELRRSRAPVFRRGPHPSHVPVCELWRTPEYIIYRIARYAHLLQGDGLSEPEALLKIDEALCLHVLTENRRASTVEDYLALLLPAHYPDYDPSLSTAALALARAQIERTVPTKGGGCWPPLDWLSSKMTPEEFKKDFASALSEPDRKVLDPSSQFDAEFAEFLVRWQDEDELWRFSSPRETWRALMGRAGVVLLRDGRSIAHIGTLMN